MSRPLAEAVGQMVQERWGLVLPVVVAGAVQVAVVIHRVPGALKSARQLLLCVGLCCTILSLCFGVYDRLGVMTPEPELSIYASSIVYSMVPLWIVLIFNIVDSFIGVVLGLVRSRHGKVPPRSVPEVQ